MKKLNILIILLFLILAACSDSPPDQSIDDNNTAANLTSQGENQNGPDTEANLGQDPEAVTVNGSIDGEGTLIFFNGSVLTMDENQPVAEAIAIQGNTILAVGDQETVFAFQDEATQFIDLEGRTLMPGFIDGHSHLISRYGEIAEDLMTTQQEILAQGITTIADMGGDRGETIAELQAMEAGGDLKMRVSMYLMQVNACGEDFGYWYQDFEQSLDPDKLVQIPGVKLFLDGGACNKIARSVGDQGDLYFTLEEATQIVSDIDARGFQAAVHALGDRAVDQVLEVMSAVIGDGPNEMRHRIEHNASVRPDQIPLYNDIKPVAMVFGGSAACWWGQSSEQFRQSPEGETLLWEWPTRSLIEGNPDVVFAWHDDAPIFQLSAIEQLWGFVTRKQLSPDGSICEPPDFAAEQTIPVETALRVMTINAAYALFRDEQVGSLEAGKFADMIILSDNPLTMDPDDLIDLQVLVTMVNGRAEFCAEGMEVFCP
jgi:predicted amidohydrolase YtcJ